MPQFSLVATSPSSVSDIFAYIKLAKVSQSLLSLHNRHTLKTLAKRHTRVIRQTTADRSTRIKNFTKFTRTKHCSCTAEEQIENVYGKRIILNVFLYVPENKLYSTRLRWIINENSIVTLVPYRYSY